MTKRLLQAIIRGYQLVLVPVVHSIVPVQGGCRFHPSCSAYANDAVERFGVLYGSWLTIKRLCRCHPWGTSGFDPVPNSAHDQALKAQHNSHFN